MSWPEEMWQHLDTGRREDLSSARAWLIALALVGLALAAWGAR